MSSEVLTKIMEYLIKADYEKPLEVSITRFEVVKMGTKQFEVYEGLLKILLNYAFELGLCWVSWEDPMCYKTWIKIGRKEINEYI